MYVSGIEQKTGQGITLPIGLSDCGFNRGHGLNWFLRCQSQALMAAMVFCFYVWVCGVGVYKVEKFPEQGCSNMPTFKPVMDDEETRPAAIVEALEDFKITADDPAQRSKRPLQEVNPSRTAI